MSSLEETETDDGTHGLVRKRVQVDRAGSPAPSCLSMKSDRSMNRPNYFSGEFTGDQRVQVDRAGSPVPSCLSMKSDRSMNRPNYFSGEFTGDQRLQVDWAGSPVPSCLSMKSDRSIDFPINFRGEFRGDQRIHCSLDLCRSDEMSSENLFSTKQGSPVQRGAVPAPDGDVPQQDSLSGCRVEGFQDLLGDSELPQLSEVIQALPCLSYHSVGVQCPCQILCDVDTEVLEISHPLYR
ncbi:uncharacterized protein LOC135245733 [Anguilla rostrata]|uniref:uncharacterized protein LOC135245733 n=1 Tax=Anguilla rostrata TaxID=7938 RepID=UPI0030CCFB93